MRKREHRTVKCCGASILLQKGSPLTAAEADGMHTRAHKHRMKAVFSPYMNKHMSHIKHTHIIYVYIKASTNLLAPIVDRLRT